MAQTGLPAGRRPRPEHRYTAELADGRVIDVTTTHTIRELVKREAAAASGAIVREVRHADACDCGIHDGHLAPL